MTVFWQLSGNTLADPWLQSVADPNFFIRVGPLTAIKRVTATFMLQWFQRPPRPPDSPMAMQILVFEMFYIPYYLLINQNFLASDNILYEIMK